MRNVEFHQFLSDSNALRVWFEVEHGHIIAFVVQLECNIEDAWSPIVRYDTAHGFAHCDSIHPYEPTQKARMATQDYNQCLTITIEDLSQHWIDYRRRYEEWLKRK